MTQYRVPVLEHFEWQQRVISTLSTPPGSPTKGDRYIVGAAATGAWTGQENNIAWYDGTTWLFDTPLQGWATYRISDSKYLTFDGTNWVAMTSSGDMTKAVYDTDNDGRVDKAESVDDGTNVTTAAQVKEAYDKRGNFDATLKVILFDL